MDREQGAGDRTGVHAGASVVLVTVLHRLADSSVSESSRRSSPLPADGVVFDGLHSSAAELCVIHLAIDVLSARMASNDAVPMAEEKHHRQTATGRHGGIEHSSYNSSTEMLIQMH